MSRRTVFKASGRRSFFAEAARELGAFRFRFLRCSLKLLKGRPKFIFALMLALMLFSGFAAFTFLRQDKKAVPKENLIAPAASGLDQIMTAGSSLAEVFSIRKEISEILKNDTLSPADSLRLECALDRLKSIQHH